MNWYGVMSLSVMLFSALIVTGLFFVLISGVIANPFYALVGFLTFCFIAGSSPIWVAKLRGTQV
jgi:hypothetical protein